MFDVHVNARSALLQVRALTVFNWVQADQNTRVYYCLIDFGYYELF